MSTKLQELIDRRAAYLQAEQQILLKGAEFQVGQGSTARRLRRADLPEIRAAITQLDTQIEAERAATTGARRLYRLVPGR